MTGRESGRLYSFRDVILDVPGAIIQSHLRVGGRFNGIKAAVYPAGPVQEPVRQAPGTYGGESLSMNAPYAEDAAAAPVYVWQGQCARQGLQWTQGRFCRRY